MFIPESSHAKKLDAIIDKSNERQRAYIMANVAMMLACSSTKEGKVPRETIIDFVGRSIELLQIDTELALTTKIIKMQEKTKAPMEVCFALDAMKTLDRRETIAGQVANLVLLLDPEGVK